MDQTSEAILGLKPVTFQYKNDEEATAQFGLIAEEVAKMPSQHVFRPVVAERSGGPFKSQPVELGLDLLPSPFAARDEAGLQPELRHLAKDLEIGALLAEQFRAAKQDQNAAVIQPGQRSGAGSVPAF